MTPPTRAPAEAGSGPPDPVTAELAACRRELEQLQRDFDGFNYAVAHDLRAPLRAVGGFLDALNEDYVRHLPAPAQAYLQRARDSTGRAQRMLDALLQLSRLGRQRLEQEVTSLSTLADEVRQELMRDAAERVIEWRTGPLPTVTCDRRLCHELFAQLFANAIKFTAGQPRAVIEVFVREGTIPPVVVVRDNGVGFNAARAEHLFMPFARFHPPQAFEGIGAGLALAAKIVRRHGGQIGVESVEGGGATFHFTLSAGPASPV
ncbi:MAG: hypothetical protein JNL92_09055 [Opitutaceae bacterium]|nr:hypothetical protein [Opitutaceae bacterium]